MSLVWAEGARFSYSPLDLISALLEKVLLPKWSRIRATFAASGAYPGQVAQNPRTAFRDFEAAARGGYAPAWFKLGRDYENFSDFAHAKDCFERGAKARVEGCAYRLGMASLLGQLGIQPSPAAALPHLARAAALATTRVSQPAYVYLPQVSIDPREFAGYIPPRGSAGAKANYP
ncbi:hypothetical protein FIBSPDRAFT_904948 [Athelia psychrophila]|uniref:HCP-like protein n=1 Tax=Athelia psychrophila TaxID=1759441 RepID=A0A167U2C9_9AGAM|nr:hypothetical protein FIBSPDRAFT_904948 [Fibularhizoctonia sp. CBS 109695]